MKEIALTQGKVALVDDEDWEFLRLVKWYAFRARQTYYAVRNVPKAGGGQNKECMHRLVLARKLGRDIKPGMVPNHIDGNGLNNQRGNLEEVTVRTNGEEKRIAKTSQYLGVSWVKSRGKWMAYIWVSGKQLYLGLHATELEAALAREAYIEAHPELGAGTNLSKITSYRIPNGET